MAGTYKKGQKISNKKFGDGKVIEANPDTIRVDFGGEIGTKTLVHKRPQE